MSAADRPATARFRDDIDLANTWVVSDTHFGHENIVGFCHRPLDHDQVMIAEWRATVPDDATVLHLGDLSYRSNARFKAITSKELTGKRKLLIAGNHDKQRYSFYRDCGFKLAYPFSLPLSPMFDNSLYVPNVDPKVPPQSRYIVSFSHYPWGSVEEEGREMTDRDWRLHGHIHNNGYQRSAFVPFLRNHINLSVEQTKYRPVNLKILLEAAILGKLPADEVDEQRLADAAAERSRERRVS